MLVRSLGQEDPLEEGTATHSSILAWRIPRTEPQGRTESDTTEARIWGFPDGSVVMNPPADAGDVCLIPGLGRVPGEGNGNPLQYSHLENLMDRGDCELLSMGSQRVRHDLVTELTCTTVCI